MPSVETPADHDADRDLGDLAVEGAAVVGRDDAGPFVRVAVTRDAIDRLAEAGYLVDGVGPRTIQNTLGERGRAAIIAEIRPDPEVDGAPPVAEVLRGERDPHAAKP